MTAVKPGKVFFERVVRCKHDDAQHQSNLPMAKMVTALEKLGWVNKGNVWVCPNPHMPIVKTPNLDRLILGQMMARPVVECALDGCHRVVGRWVLAKGPENDRTLRNRLHNLGWYQKNNFWYHPSHKATKSKKDEGG